LTVDDLGDLQCGASSLPLPVAADRPDRVVETTQVELETTLAQATGTV